MKWDKASTWQALASQTPAEHPGTQQMPLGSSSTLVFGVCKQEKMLCLLQHDFLLSWTLASTVGLTG